MMTPCACGFLTLLALPYAKKPGVGSRRSRIGLDDGDAIRPAKAVVYVDYQSCVY